MREVWKKFFATLTLDRGGRKNKKKCYKMLNVCFKKVTLKILKIFRKINRGGGWYFFKKFRRL